MGGTKFPGASAEHARQRGGYKISASARDRVATKSCFWQQFELLKRNGDARIVAGEDPAIENQRGRTIDIVSAPEVVPMDS